MLDNSLINKLPKRINGLADMAYNLWWSWQLDARELFKVLDRTLWTVTVHNPVQMLQHIPQSQLVAASQNPDFLERYDAVMAIYKEDMLARHTWFNNSYPNLAQHQIAYFSLEFAIHNSLPIYAGGLGILAGDYCKEASDLGLPMIGVGFMYPQGYFHQHINIDGWQEEIYQQLNFGEAPAVPVLTSKGKPLKVKVPLDEHAVHVAIWLVKVGRVKLYLLDTNIEENTPADRQLSARLYVADREIRLQQEIIIGIGGVRALRALGLKPCIWHANEGHTTFMMLERLREFIGEGLSFDKALKEVQASTIFTTHTPVPAGNDVFSRELIEKYLYKFLSNFKTNREKALNLGIQKSDDSAFNMTALGMNMANQRNAVSQLHATTCHRIWHSLWPDIPENEVPITYVTNGVHFPTWLSPQMHGLYNQYLGKNWLNNMDDNELWQQVLNIPDDQLWEMRRWLKLKLVRAIEDRVRQRWSEDAISPSQTMAMGALLDTEVLTVGFCRRSTEYKRATLIFHDIERLKRILKNKLNPVQIVFSGKAHPNDITGKYLIQEIYKLAREPEFEGRIAFVENYDLHMARFLVQGIDVWLNNPRWLEEACGTSGMKACLNGSLHLSTLDGWWNEGYNGKNGFAIEYDPASQDIASIDKSDSDQIYRLLEEKIIPLFYARDLNGIPHDWIKLIKESIRSIAPIFNTRRMAKEYTQSMYLKAIDSCKTGHAEIEKISSVIDYSV